MSRERELKSLVVRYWRDRLHHVDSRVGEWGGPLEPVYRRVRPLVRLGIMAAWCGIWVELDRAD